MTELTEESRVRGLLSNARKLARKSIKQLRRTLVPRHEGIVSGVDDKYLVILREKFLHDRSTLEPLIERITARDLMVEVGSLAGFSTKVFARHFKKVFSIDPYSPGYDDANDKNSDDFRLRIAKDLFTVRFVDEPHVVQYREPSATGCARFADRSLDFVYLDGSHTYDDVDLDIRSWRPKIKPGGFLAGDDYSWEGVERAVKGQCDKFEVIEGRWLAHIA